MAATRVNVSDTISLVASRIVGPKLNPRAAVIGLEKQLVIEREGIARI
ncbi:hypothetical protein HRbin36_02658 [bacterium HR36]|nr:hypothetical protein HRbin36_02658 [bacterium HR36]